MFTGCRAKPPFARPRRAYRQGRSRPALLRHPGPGEPNGPPPARRLAQIRRSPLVLGLRLVVGFEQFLLVEIKRLCVLPDVTGIVNAARQHLELTALDRLQVIDVDVCGARYLFECHPAAFSHGSRNGERSAAILHFESMIRLRRTPAKSRETVNQPSKRQYPRNPPSFPIRTRGGGIPLHTRSCPPPRGGPGPNSRRPAVEAGAA
mgnify:CR=1 FL=1